MGDVLVTIVAHPWAIQFALIVMLLWFLVVKRRADTAFALIDDEFKRAEQVPWAESDLQIKAHALAGDRIIEELFRWYQVRRAYLANPIAPSPFMQDWLSADVLETYDVARAEYAHRQATYLYLIGMVFTFVGLLASFIATYNAAHSSDLVAMLKALLAASAFKFAASLMGVVLGLLFLTVAHRRRTELQAKLATLRHEHVTTQQMKPATFMTHVDAKQIEHVIQAANDRMKSVETHLLALVQQSEEQERTDGTSSHERFRD